MAALLSTSSNSNNNNHYSWSKFGREAEYIVALYLKSIGWSDIRLSRGSRGPADIIAIPTKSSDGGSDAAATIKWLIQVKASGGIPRLKGYEVKRLMNFAKNNEGLPVIATYQALDGGFSIGNFSILFYLLDSWKKLDPNEPLGRQAHIFLKS